MPRDLRANESMKRAKAKRQAALNRPEMLQPTTPRISADGPISMAVKAEDQATRRMIDDALTARGAKVIRPSMGSK